mmetsp:Transcript_29783/g.39627  ORF Transcript_29783/g.39627 Transcript_29783/m.39627 type:complete len:125 (+) Transcript_29783:396-770(+)
MDMIVETYAACMDTCAHILYETDFQGRPSAMEQLRDGLLSKFIAMCEVELQKNVYSQFIVGEHMSIADVVLASFIFNVLKNEEGPFERVFFRVLVKFPFFNQYVKRMQNVFSMQLKQRKRHNIF